MKTKQELDQRRNQWMEWMHLCVAYVHAAMESHDIFELKEVKAMLKAKEENRWDITHGRAIFDLWQGKKPPWKSEYEGSIMQSLYLHACGPLARGNYIEEEEEQEDYSTNIMRKDIAFTSDVVTTSLEIVNGFAHGLTLFKLGDDDFISTGPPPGHYDKVRQDMENLFPRIQDASPSETEEKSGKKKSSKKQQSSA